MGLAHFQGNAVFSASVRSLFTDSPAEIVSIFSKAEESFSALLKGIGCTFLTLPVQAFEASRTASEPPLRDALRRRIMMISRSTLCQWPSDCRSPPPPFPFLAHPVPLPADTLSRGMVQAREVALAEVDMDGVREECATFSW